MDRRLNQENIRLDKISILRKKQMIQRGDLRIGHLMLGRVANKATIAFIIRLARSFIFFACKGRRNQSTIDHPYQCNKCCQTDKDALHVGMLPFLMPNVNLKPGEEFSGPYNTGNTIETSRAGLQSKSILSAIRHVFTAKDS